MKGEGSLSNLDLNPGASAEVLEAAQRALGCALPPGYAQFLRKWNGGEGFIGDNYLILWKAEELKQFNDEYEVAEYAPGLLFFGSNGGGEAYAFDTREDPWVVARVPFIGMDLKHAKVIGRNFADFLRRLA
jgi:hypothetical protein